MSIFSFIASRLPLERQREASELARFDTTSFPVDLDLPARPFRPGELKPVLTVHVTDADDGYGVAKYQIDKWRARLQQGKVPADLLAQLPAPLDLGGSSYTLALLERYSRLAYHYIGSRRVGTVRNHPASLRTSASNNGNIGLAWSLDCGNTETLSPALVAAGMNSLTEAIVELHDVTGTQVIVVPHRAWQYPGRAEDPGREVWQRVVVPVVELLGKPVCVIGYNTKAGSGLPVPVSWDPRAIYDAKGRRIEALGPWTPKS